MREPFEHACYLENVFRPDYLQRTLENAKQTLSKIPFDTLAFAGMSGALFAPILAREMNKYILLVRKTADKTHSQHTLEGYHGTKLYVIVDDFIAEGKTVRRIHRTIKKALPQARCAAVYLYNRNALKTDYFRELSLARTAEAPAKAEKPLCTSFEEFPSGSCPCSICSASRALGSILDGA